MKPSTQRKLFNKTVAVATLFCMVAQPVFVAAAPPVGLDLATEPLFIGSAVPPMVMLNVPKDHQMFGKLYNDFTDVDGNGEIDTSYRLEIDYYGYFDPFKCYTYQTNLNGTGRGGYAPTGLTDPQHYCPVNSNQWSGNFLNWASMTRLDAVRKLLYGGFRVVDNPGMTILERATVPSDGHSWAKHYRGTDFDKLTPFTTAEVARTEPLVTSFTPGTLKQANSIVSINRTSCPPATPSCTTTVRVQTSVAHNLQRGMYAVMTGGSAPYHLYTNAPRLVTNIVSPSEFEFELSVTAGSPPTPALGIFQLTARHAVEVPQTSPRPFLPGDSVTVRGNASNLLRGAIRTVTPTSPGNVLIEVEPHQAVVAGLTVSFLSATVAVPPVFPPSPVVGRWRVTNHSAPGITICNTTNLASGLTPLSHEIIGTGSYPPSTNSNTQPFMRVARGDYSLWAVAEGKMCQWVTAATVLAVGINGNRQADSELKASQTSPVHANVGLPISGMPQADYSVRVRVCEDGRIGEKEKCFKYNGAGNWKPTGLLQHYGSNNRKLIQFGLMTPSYAKNKAGGVLRKQVGFLDNRTDFQNPYSAVDPDEVDPVSGVFRNVDGIIKTLNSIQIYGYAWNSSPNPGYGADNCPGVVVNPDEDKCTSWGNPTSEMFIESLRYLAGKAAPSADYMGTMPSGDSFGSGGLGKDAALNMKVQGWNKPLTNENWCAPLNVIVMNASVSSYDNDQIPTDLFTGGTDAHKETTKVGEIEGFTEGKALMVGKVSQPQITAAPHPVTDAASGIGLCTPKKLGGNGLADVMGICPEAPMLGGSYLIAGAAAWARDHRIIPNLKRFKGGDLPPGDVTSARVNTYGITLSGASPKIKVDVPNASDERQVTILPAGRTLSSASTYAGTGAIVDFKVVRQNAKLPGDPSNNASYQSTHGPTGTGKFFVSWEDSMQGSDYDLDAWGIIDYEFLPFGGPYTQIRVTTDVIYAVSVYSMGFGYVVSGVKGDARIEHNGRRTYGEGVHFTSAHRGGTNFNWPPADMTIGGQGMRLGDECNNCSFSDGRRSIVFDLAGKDDASVALEEPLYYAAAHGGYKDNNKNGKRDAREWDSRKEGVPDNYFLVSNPARLEEALEQSFISILAQASASSVATNSTSLNAGTRIYQARFNTNDWSGQVRAFDVDPANGRINPVHAWDASTLLSPLAIKPDQRILLTYDPASRKGIEFTMTDAPPDLKKALYTPPGSAAEDPAGTECAGTGPAGLLPVGCTRLGEMRLNYLRGDGANEGSGGTNFRERPVTKLGDIVNSNPAFVGAPSAGFADQDYAGFRLIHKDRKPMLYVAANDGMLHGFSVNESGKEYFGYVPTSAWRSLTQLTDKAYKHRYIVDGSPEVSDAFLERESTKGWHTVLVGSLGAGGHGVYALDVSTPASFLTKEEAVKNVLWEFTDRDDPNLGYVIGQPLIRRMHSNLTTYPNGRWAAIIPGGYNNSEGTDASMPGETACGNSDLAPATHTPDGCTTSTTGYAYLFILFLDGPRADGKWTLGDDYIRISTEVGDKTNPNGLASPFAADVNADGKVDFIYAGDLRGNFYKFDVRSATPSQWSTRANQVKLFTAESDTGEVQPITAKAEGTLHPSAGGFVISFGTGKYLERRDPDPAPTGPKYAVQSYYGIWDRNDTVPIQGQTRATHRRQLLKQTIDTLQRDVTVNGVTSKVNFRVVSAHVPGLAGKPIWSVDTGAPPNDANAGTAVMGWYMDFPDATDGTRTGERSVFRPILVSGRLVFTTLIPNPLKCEAGGTSFLMVVDPVTGGRVQAAVLDVDGKGELNNSDTVRHDGVDVFVSGVESAIGITPTPTIVRSDSGSPSDAPKGSEVFLGARGPLLAGVGFLLAYALAAGSSGGNSSTMIGLASMGGRVSWRELLSD